MITFTHGQPATPTSFGKQMNVFAYKISDVIDDLYEDYRYKQKWEEQTVNLLLLN